MDALHLPRYQFHQTTPAALVGFMTVYSQAMDALHLLLHQFHQSPTTWGTFLLHVDGFWTIWDGSEQKCLRVRVNEFVITVQNKPFVHGAAFTTLFVVTSKNVDTCDLFVKMEQVKLLHIFHRDCCQIHYSNKLKEHVDIMIFIERYPLKRCQGCVKLIASKVNCFLNITDLSEVQLCMSSNSGTWECPHTKDGADHVPLIFLSSV